MPTKGSIKGVVVVVVLWIGIAVATPQGRPQGEVFGHDIPVELQGGRQCRNKTIPVTRQDDPGRRVRVIVIASTGMVNGHKTKGIIPGPQLGTAVVVAGVFQHQINGKGARDALQTTSNLRR